LYTVQWTEVLNQRVLMNYRGPAFSASYDWLVPHPLSKLDRPHIGRLRKRDILPTGEGGGAVSYDGKRAWFSINHSILSGLLFKTGERIALTEALVL